MSDVNEPPAREPGDVSGLIDSRQVGAMYGRSPGTARRWTRSGAIPYAALDVSGAYWYDEAAVRAAVAENLVRVRRPGRP